MPEKTYKELLAELRAGGMPFKEAQKEASRLSKAVPEPPVGVDATGLPGSGAEAVEASSEPETTKEAPESTEEVVETPVDPEPEPTEAVVGQPEEPAVDPEPKKEVEKPATKEEVVEDQPKPAPKLKIQEPVLTSHDRQRSAVIEGEIRAREVTLIRINKVMAGSGVSDFAVNQAGNQVIVTARGIRVPLRGCFTL